VIDAFADYKLGNADKGTMGQFLIPFSYDNLTSSSKLDLINRALVVNALCPGRDTGNDGRDIGIQFSGSRPVSKSTTKLDYFAALFNGSGIDTSDNNNAKDPALRAVWHTVPTGLHFGASLYDGELGTAKTTHDRFGLEAVYLAGDWGAKSEYIWANNGASDAKGYYATFLHRFSPRIEGAIRFDNLNPDTSTPDDLITATVLGINYNLSTNALNRIQLNYEWRRGEGTQPSFDQFLAQLQAGF
jgi:phosphate-selective porin